MSQDRGPRVKTYSLAELGLDKASANEPAPCVTHETTYGDHVICQTCGGMWERGKDRACIAAIALLKRAGIA